MVSENCSYIGVSLLVPYIQNKISQCFFSSTSPCYVWLNMPMKLWTCSWLLKLTMKTGNWILAEPINSPPPCKLSWCPGDHQHVLLMIFFFRKFEFHRKLILSFDFQPPDHYNILHMPRQLCCQVMCKILQQSINQNLYEKKLKFPLNGLWPAQQCYIIANWILWNILHLN